MFADKKLDWKQHGALWPNHDVSIFIEADDTTWHVQRRGKAGNPVMLMMHGTGASLHSWNWLVPFFCNAYEVITIDLPGHGFTCSDQYRSPTLPGVAASVGALTKSLSVKPDILVGHSAGAAIMVEMIAQNIVAPSLAVSINGALMPFAGAAGFIFPVMAKMLHINPLTASFFARSARDPRRVKRLIEQTGSKPPAQSVACYARMFTSVDHVAGALAMMANWDLTSIPNRLADIDKPILFIAGDRDRAVPPADASRCAEIAPYARVKTLKGLGHLAHEEAPDQVAGLIHNEIG